MIYIALEYTTIYRHVFFFTNLHHRFSLPIRRLHLARAGHVFLFRNLVVERWAVRLGSTQTTTNTKILGTYPIRQSLRCTVFFFFNCKRWFDGWFTLVYLRMLWLCFCETYPIYPITHDILFFSVFFFPFWRWGINASMYVSWWGLEFAFCFAKVSEDNPLWITENVFFPQTVYC